MGTIVFGQDVKRGMVVALPAGNIRIRNVERISTNRWRIWIDGNVTFIVARFAQLTIVPELKCDDVSGLGSGEAFTMAPRTYRASRKEWRGEVFGGKRGERITANMRQWDYTKKDQHA